MRPPPPCPTSDALRRFGLGLICDAEAAALEAHLAGCPACTSALANSDATDRLVADLRQEPPVALWAADAQAVNELIDRCQAWPAAGAPGCHVSTMTGGPPSTVPVVLGDGSANLLEAPVGPDEMGRLGRYRVRRTLGSGGMGIVYLADDPALRRPVALKVLRGPQAGSARFDQRFRREGEAAARLNHPNIVPVFEVGESAGRTYLAFEYVAGGSLAQYLAGRPQPPRNSALLVRALAKAIDHAHRAGVIHRDLKPDNVLLAGPGTPAAANDGPPDLTGAPESLLPKVTDFGLARLLDDDGLTPTGDLLGTPCYMAPEQTRGRNHRVGPAADIYALGAILYECLVGRPPFQGETVLETVEMVRDRDPVSPRQIRPGLPRDLETICLKCLQKEPGRRYVTAADLADDLGRFLDRKPVRARPVGRAARLVKWARRKPAWAVLAVVGLGAAVGGVAYQVQLSRALSRAEANAESARVARAQLIDNFRASRDLIRQMLRQGESRARAGVPQAQESLRELRESVLSYYLGVADQAGDDREVRFEAAAASVEAGTLQLALGRRADALTNLRLGRERFAALAADFPDAPDYRDGEAAALNNLSVYHADNPAEARRCLEQALKLYEGLVGQFPQLPGYRASLAGTLTNLGGTCVAVGDAAGAADYFRRVLDLREKICHDRGNAFEDRVLLALAKAHLSLVWWEDHNTRAAAGRLHAEAETLLLQLLDARPGDAAAVCVLARLRINWTNAQFARGQRGAAETALADNSQRLEAVLRREPNHAEARDLLMWSHRRWADSLKVRGQFQDEVEHRRRELAWGVPDDRPGCVVRLATALFSAGDYQAAVAEVDPLTDFTVPGDWVDCAAIYAQSIPRVNAAGDRTIIERYAGRALELLRKCKAAVPSADWARIRPTLAPPADLTLADWKQQRDLRFASLWRRDDYRRLTAP